MNAILVFLIMFVYGAVGALVAGFFLVMTTPGTQNISQKYKYVRGVSGFLIWVFWPVAILLFFTVGQFVRGK
jgi:hypothetical protein